MPKSIHLICKRVGIGLKGLAPIDPKAGIYRSETWGISDVDAVDLLGGWIYFHPTKAAKSEFGGRIVRTELSGHLTHHGVPEIAIVFESKPDARDRKWRGASHGMAWTGGLVEMTYEFEMASAT